MSNNIRKWLGIAITIICYYFVHEGAHLIVALILGVFQEIRFMGIGMQIVIEASALSNIQLAVFCVVGSAAALIFGYILVLLRNRILLSQSKILKAACYYTTLGLLLLDPIYLSVLYGFFGGGDMNGIILFGIPETAVRIIYAVIGVTNIFVCIKYIYPAYKQNFAES